MVAIDDVKIKHDAARRRGTITDARARLTVAFAVLAGHTRPLDALFWLTCRWLRRRGRGWVTGFGLGDLRTIRRPVVWSTRDPGRPVLSSEGVATRRRRERR